MKEHKNRKTISTDEKDQEEGKRKFKDECYEAYKLQWMISQGLTIRDYLDALIEASENALEAENYPEGDTRDHFESFDNDFEYENGFNGSLWVCKDEFLTHEFLDLSYMNGLIDLMPDSLSKQIYYRKLLKEIRK